MKNSAEIELILRKKLQKEEVSSLDKIVEI